MRNQRIDLAIRLVASLVTAGAICGIAWSVGPGSFDIRTDIVGYPIVQDFNPRTYTFRYLLVAVAFPLLALGIWWALGRLAKRQGSPPGDLLPRALPADEEDPAAARGGATPLAYLKLAAVGLLIATAVAIGVDASSAWPLTIGIPITLAYVGLARLAAELIPTERAGSTLHALSAINAVVGALSLLAIGVAATATEVVIANPPQTVDYEFVPLGAVAVVALAVGALVWWLLWRSPASTWRRIEVWTLLLVVAPVGLFLWIAFLPGEQPPPDYFHEGERLGGSNLVFGHDEFPWRDVLFAHGLLSDVLLPELDTALVEHSRWGMIAGQDLIEWPLLWISMLALSIYLYRRNWVFLVATQLLLVFGWFDEFRNSRLILVPLSLLALAVLLERSTWPRAIGLMAITLAQVVVAPEAIVYSVAVWAVVVAFELVHHRAEGTEPLRTSRTLRCAVAGGGLLAGIAVFLGAEAALDEFVGYYRTFIGGHELTGTFPIEWTDFKFRIWAYLPVAVILIAWGYAAARVWSRRWLTIPDWVVGASVIGLIPYYVKFLARADEGHLYQVATMALIPALYVIYRLLQFVDRRAESSRRPLLPYRPATLAFVVFVCVLVSSPLATIRDLPSQYSARASEAPPSDRLGYMIPGDVEVLVRRVQRVVDKYAKGGTVFDFTNSPAMFDYFLDAEPATRFFHVSMAVRGSTQDDVIDELRSEQPELVAYSSTLHGLSNWDVVPNPVRHYLISDYLLDNYHPVARVDDYVFMARNRDPVAPPEVGHPRDLLFDGLPCEWGYAPNFLDDEPSDPEAAVDLEVSEEGASTGAGGWAVDVEAGRPAVEVLLADGDRVIATAHLGVRRSDVAAQLGPDFTYSGFEFRGLLPRRYAADPETLSYFGVARSGVASELGEPAERPPNELRMPDGGRVPVEQGAVQGSLDYILPVMARYRLDAPEDFHDFDWLAVDAPPAPDGSRLILSDGEAGGTRTIAYNALPDRDSLQVRVGACSQWKGYRSGPLYVDVTPETGPISARLIR